MFKGLPGSGKTTVAHDRIERRKKKIYGEIPTSVPANQIPITRVNKDDIRAELETKAWQWSQENEKDVILIRDSRIRQALSFGFDVISDDTNFGKHEATLRKLAEDCHADFAVDDSFCQVPIEECIRRDGLRVGKAQVGEAVIRGMAKRNGIAQVNPQKYEADPDCMPAIICDIDGTLALNLHRDPYDTSKYMSDEIHYGIRDIIRLFHDTRSYQIVYMSGRDDAFRQVTKDWLDGFGCPPGPLWMRAAGDKREDSIVKSELFDVHVRGCYNVKFVLDDRDRVVKMWRSMGLTCLQVAEGAF